MAAHSYRGKPAQTEIARTAFWRPLVAWPLPQPCATSGALACHPTWCQACDLSLRIPWRHLPASLGVWPECDRCSLLM